ncbi:uncharacterized protein ACLA_069860 [Aspergillus clavatus NRRL 1]|uniref:Extracellular mutant protein 11 C-terminal domain-containing protein n=1 Tax=Aspergillus clavatus (strain ATCC 1007 / CBS 513.65 / DSM 816 / NCTC 3887 / NRRL 1 / QM 1276 / 107) TaxID=344612 RepID=A1C6D4_ASPCL|nr:uncharacterized protein ACLA_069860 [Aspergillus clavatus NRRL 1]EAW13955.1 conserved hypothetical protein [Aspergillus clavatus NRRL 1]
MGVGDYVHSKEAGPQSTTNDASNQSRQALAAQARVEIPATKLVAPVPVGMNGRAQLDAYGGVTFPQPSQVAHENAMHRDMFDTDVEGVDDSTVAELSVVGVDEATPQHQLPPPPSAQYQEPEPKALYQLRHGRRPQTSNWYENLGDKAIKTAGFESDDADDDASQMTSVAGDDRADENNDWYLSHKHRHIEEPLSKRLEGFWSASRRSYSKPGNQPQREASRIPALGGTNGNRKIVLPRSMTATPRTRFSPPKPSLLDKLEISPTRPTNGPRAQPGRKNSLAGFTHDPEGDAGLFANDHGRRDSEPSITAFDITNFDDLDDDDTIRDPFSRRASVKRISLDTTQTKKRVLEPDYPPEILAKKTFDELQAEPFDFDPATARTTVTLNPSQDPSAAEQDRVAFLLRLSEKDRQTYLSNLSIDEWEDCGDQLIEQFTKLLTDMKDLRRARRKTAAVFEAEVKRRHEVVQDQRSDLARKLNEMRTGGVEVLRGRTP